MKFVGLISGGKDSVFAIGKALTMGHKLVCTANLFYNTEADSFMFQTVGTLYVPAISCSLGVPLISKELQGNSICKEMNYVVTEKDEVEDLYELISEAKYRFPDLQAVVSGAVMSDYQRIRVENVCSRLGLTSISPLWRINQKDLLLEMKELGYQSVIIKVSSMGLQEKHLGAPVSDLIEYFETLQKKFGFNVAGEGGEYETLILDAPIMTKKLVLSETEKVMTSDSQAGYLQLKKVLLEDKTSLEIEEFRYSEKKYPKVYRRHSEFFIGEITADNLGGTYETFELEAFAVLKGLKEVLGKSGLALQNVFYLTAYIRDMKDYLSFNAVYSKFFGFPNPPSRVCCELGSQDCRLKISVKASISSKKCIHVQSISSWAPASIGPYSQSYELSPSLHLAGSIPLIPQSMTLSDSPLSQILENCKSVAQISKFQLENPELCIVYFTQEKFEVAECYNPLYVQVTGLPRNSPLEIEFHLQQNLPEIEKSSAVIEEVGFKFVLEKRNCRELVYANWHFIMEKIEDFEGFLSCAKGLIEEWFASVPHKSGATKEQLLSNSEMVVTFMDYITEIRVFAPEPYQFKKDWVVDTPVVYLHSATTAIYIQLQDYPQISTYQFINSGN